MEEEILKRILQNEKLFNKEEREFILKNRKIVLRIYLTSMVDTYKMIKEC